ncbi:hypothetical protein Tco_0887669 [Tanacetum coccineum]
MEQYLQCIDYTLWEIVENGNAPIVAKTVDGKETVIPPISVEEKAQRRVELKARSTLLMSLTNEHQLKFNSYKDAKTLMQAIKNRFGGLPMIAQHILILSDAVIYSFFFANQYSTVDNAMIYNKSILMSLEGDGLVEETLQYTDYEGKRFLKQFWMEAGHGNKERISLKVQVGVFSLHKRGHFARECRAPKNQDSRNRKPTRRTVPVEETTLNALVS